MGVASNQSKLIFNLLRINPQSDINMRIHTARSFKKSLERIEDDFPQTSAFVCLGTYMHLERE